MSLSKYYNAEGELTYAWENPFDQLERDMALPFIATAAARLMTPRGFLRAIRACEPDPVRMPVSTLLNIF
jgi:hypothetical protein